MANVVMASFARKKRAKDKEHPGLVLEFLSKLGTDHTLPGLHVEPINRSADARARTGRVTKSLRAVLIRLDGSVGEPTFCYLGTYEHDEAIEIAQTVELTVNPINGIAELRFGAPRVPESVERALVAAREAEALAEAEVASDAGADDAETTTADSYLAAASYLPSDLLDTFGLPGELVELAFACRTADELLDLSAIADVPYHGDVLLAMAAGDNIGEIQRTLLLDDAITAAEPAAVAEVEDGDSGELARTSSQSGTDADTAQDDDAVLAAMRRPAARMQFAFVDGEDDDELRRIIEGGSIADWRIFLHPEQQALVERGFRGPGRVSGGAGTGKTVVLLHRARHLSRQRPDARVVLTTYTKALAANLERDLGRLDAEVHRAPRLGSAGVHVAGVDQLASRVRQHAGPAFSDIARAVLGHPVESSASPNPTTIESIWQDVVDDRRATLVGDLASIAFLRAEYEQVILPQRVVSRSEYRAVARSGRKVSLNRRRRDAVWDAIEGYRRATQLANVISFAEVAAVAAAWVQDSGTTLADHVLVDEGQDLHPSQWLLLRAIVGEHEDDLFIAEDSHQRIYGQHVVLSRLGIRIVGRSRRLKLNYRTTAQNLRYAMAVLVGGEYADSTDDPDEVEGYRSARRGPEPLAIRADSMGDQYDEVAKMIAAWTGDEEEPVEPGAIAVLVRSNAKVEEVARQLRARGVLVDATDDARRDASRPQVLTMHRAKGLEFSRVILFDVSAQNVPMERWLAKEAAPDREDALLRERSVLYVAASRARDQLAVTWVGEPSTLLEDALAAPQAVDVPIEEPVPATQAADAAATDDQASSTDWSELPEEAWPIIERPEAPAAPADRDAEILRLWTEELLVLEEIGARFGLTRERVRQILAKLGAPSAAELRVRRAGAKAQAHDDAVRAVLDRASDAIDRYMDQGISRETMVERLQAQLTDVDEAVIRDALRQVPAAFAPERVKHAFPESVVAAALWYILGVANAVAPSVSADDARATEDPVVVDFLDGYAPPLPSDAILRVIASARVAAEEDASLTVSAARYETLRGAALEQFGLDSKQGTTPWPPTKQTINKRLGEGSWADALASQGLGIARAGRKRGLLHFTADDYTDAVAAFAETAMRAGQHPSFDRYEAWVGAEAKAGRRRPSGAGVRLRFGGWAMALNMARRGRGRHQHTRPQPPR